MILPKKTVNEIERYFFGHDETEQYINQRELEISESYYFTMDRCKIRTSQPGNPTEKRALKIENELGRLKRWSKVYAETVNKFKDDPKGELFEHYYVQHKHRHRVCIDLCLSEPLFYVWRNEILIYAAFRACEYQLISVI